MTEEEADFQAVYVTRWIHGGLPACRGYHPVETFSLLWDGFSDEVEKANGRECYNVSWLELANRIPELTGKNARWGDSYLPDQGRSLVNMEGGDKGGHKCDL